MVMLFLVLDKACSINFSNFPCAGDVWFSLNCSAYQNNSCVTLEDNGTALFCRTDSTAFCKLNTTLEKWYFPNGSEVCSAGCQCDSDFRGNMVECMHCRRGGVDGIYHCVIPDSTNVTQTIYIGVYSAGSGEWYMYTQLFCPKYHLP